MAVVPLSLPDFLAISCSTIIVKIFCNFGNTLCIKLFK
jgi:hypothetical protein